MRKNVLMRALATLLAAVLILACLPVAAAELQIPDGLTAVLVMEASSGWRVAEREADSPMAVAGLARLPALYGVCSLIDEGRLAAGEVTVSERAAKIGGPSAYLKAGEKIAPELLLKAAIMISAGDAMFALIEAICGSEEAFLAELNQRMAALGVGEAANAMGHDMKLSAAELGMLGAALHKSATFRTYSALTYELITHEDGRETELASANRLLRSCAGCSGTATGSSQADGYCGVFAVERSGACYICVVLGAKNAAARTEAATSMLEYAFANFIPKTLAKKGQVFGMLPVAEGQKENVELIAEKDVTVLLPPNSQCQTEVILPESLNAPVFSAVAAGKAEFTCDGGAIAYVRLMPRDDVPVAGVMDYFRLVLLELLH